MVKFEETDARDNSAAACGVGEKEPGTDSRT